MNPPHQWMERIRLRRSPTHVLCMCGGRTLGYWLFSLYQLVFRVPPFGFLYSLFLLPYNYSFLRPLIPTRTRVYVVPTFFCAYFDSVIMHPRCLPIGLYTPYTDVLLYTYSYTRPPPLLAPPSSAVKSPTLSVLPAVLSHSNWSNVIYRLNCQNMCVVAVQYTA